jgi:glycine C-acetyltransferase
MLGGFGDYLAAKLGEMDSAGLLKSERPLGGPQGARILAGGREVLNFCSNNYLGLANHPAVVAAAEGGLAEWGFGLSSVRFICGTQELHLELERRVAAFLGMEAAILFSSCFDANGGVFEALLGEEDAVVSDALNHASLIDGIRLCKARRLRYRNSDLADLEAQLQAAADARFKLIATDGVFSMDGSIAPLDGICALAERYGALVLADDSHGVGVLGSAGRGSPDYRGVAGRVDIVTGTFGKALGGAGGGYVASSRPVVDYLRQRSRPYLFSNTLPPPLAAAALAALDLAAAADAERTRLRGNAAYFRSGLAAAGFELLPGEHPIIAVMLGEARAARGLAARLLEKGVYVVGFAYPVVPEGRARIRVQLSALHSRADLDFAVDAFAAAKRELGL